MFARLEAEMKAMLKSQEDYAQATKEHRIELDATLEKLTNRVVNIENQLLGGKAFAHGFRYAIYLGWCIVGSVCTTFIMKFMEHLK